MHMNFVLTKSEETLLQTNFSSLYILILSVFSVFRLLLVSKKAPKGEGISFSFPSFSFLLCHYFQQSDCLTQESKSKKMNTTGFSGHLSFLECHCFFLHWSMSYLNGKCSFQGPHWLSFWYRFLMFALTLHNSNRLKCCLHHPPDVIYKCCTWMESLGMSRIICISSAHMYLLLSHWTLFTKHKFKEKMISTFRDWQSIKSSLRPIQVQGPVHLHNLHTRDASPARVHETLCLSPSHLLTTGVVSHNQNTLTQSSKGNDSLREGENGLGEDKYSRCLPQEQKTRGACLCYFLHP